MRKKGFWGLIAMLMLVTILVTGCGSLNTGESSVEREATEETDKGKELDLSEIYSLVADAIIYMFTDGGNAEGYYMTGNTKKGVGYQYDINNDGIKDWIVSAENWLICSKGTSDFSCYLFPQPNAATHIYGSSNNQLVVTQGNGLANYSWLNHMVYDGEGLQVLAEEMTEFLSAESVVTQYKVKGECTDEITYQTTIDKLGKLTELELVPFEFEKRMSIESKDIEFVISKMKHLPIVSQIKEADIDADGKMDYVLYLFSEWSEGPQGINITYGDGSDINNQWCDCCIILTSAEENIETQICTVEEAENVLWRAGVNEVMRANATLPDGEYEAVIYEEALFGSEEETCAYAEIQDFIVFENDYVMQLKRGDIIQLQEYGMTDIIVEKMESMTDKFSIEIAEGYRLVRNKKGFINIQELDDSVWLLVGYSDYIYRYTKRKAVLFFADGAVIVDNLSYNCSGYGEPEMKVDNIHKLFASPNVSSSERVNIKIKDGKVVELILYYHP